MTARQGLTVIVPFHDLAERVPGTLRSLRAAAGDGTHFLLVDDGSRDSTAERLLLGTRDWPRTRVITHDRNLGLSAVRNRAMAEVETDWLTFLDGDDAVSRGYFEALETAARRSGAPLVRTDHLEVVGTERLLRRVPTRARQGRLARTRDSIAPAERMTAIDHCNLWAGACHRDLLEAGALRLREDLRTAEDRLWIWQVFLTAETFTVPDLVGVRYRRDVAHSASSTLDSRQLDFVAAMDAVLDLVGADREADRFLPKALRRHLELLLRHLARLDAFAPGVGRTFELAARDSLHRVDEALFDTVLATMTPERAGTIRAFCTRSEGSP